MPERRLDLGKLQTALNKDAATKKRFLEAPVKTLEAEGFALTPEQQHKVAYLVDRVKRPGALVEGAGIAPGKLAAITITIGVDF
jgi:hypothetical protein